MRKKEDLYLTQRVIDLLIKAAGVILTSVATYQVANDTFGHLAAPFDKIVAIGALLLVEGAFVATWFAIDTQRLAPMAMKISWASTLVILYIALLIIGIVNGEGSAGWAFRLILAIMIGKSIYEAGVYEVLRNARKADQDITSSYAVRRLKLKFEREKEINNMVDQTSERAYRRDLAAEISRAQLEAEHEAAMIDVGLHKEQLMQRVHAKDSLARGQFLASMAQQEMELDQLELETAQLTVSDPHEERAEV